MKDKFRNDTLLFINNFFRCLYRFIKKAINIVYLFFIIFLFWEPSRSK